MDWPIPYQGQRNHYSQLTLNQNTSDGSRMIVLWIAVMGCEAL
jgi:hypothetical protein